MRQLRPALSTGKANDEACFPLKTSGKAGLKRTKNRFGQDYRGARVGREVARREPGFGLLDGEGWLVFKSAALHFAMLPFLSSLGVPLERIR